MDCTLKRREILRRRADLRRLRRNGRRVPGAVLFLRFAPAPDPKPAARMQTPGRRIAFLLPRGIRSAVRRNRLKRRLREAYRTSKSLFPAGNDYALRATIDAADLGHRDIKEHIRRLAEGVARGG